MRFSLEPTEMYGKTRSKTLVITVVKEYVSVRSENCVMIQMRDESGQRGNQAAN